MKKLLRELMVVGLLAVFTVSGFAQRREDKRPPKEPGKVVEPGKKQPPPPPQNSNRPKGDKKKP